jgi:hypothetical protein
MLSRFVCPADRLAELGEYVSLFGETSPLQVSALGRAGQSVDDFLSGLNESLAQIAAFREVHGARVAVETIELPLPPNLQSPISVARSVSERIEAIGPPRLKPFYEAPNRPGPADVAETVDAIASHNARWKGKRCQPAGFKLRTGGVVADAIPTPERVAFALTTCRERGVALKCTAGLHHPLRRFDASVQSKMHGFMNVFGAGVLGHSHALGPTGVQSIIEDELAEHFRFDAGGFAWGDLRATTQHITEARQIAVLSFGSCDFDEPREDLRALGWL